MIRRAEQIDMAQETEDMAQECRRLARATKHELVREELLEVAERFDRLARMRQQQKRPESVSSN